MLVLVVVAGKKDILFGSVGIFFEEGCDVSNLHLYLLASLYYLVGH